MWTTFWLWTWGQPRATRGGWLGATLGPRRMTRRDSWEGIELKGGDRGYWLISATCRALGCPHVHNQKVVRIWTFLYYTIYNIYWLLLWCMQLYINISNQKVRLSLISLPQHFGDHPPCQFNSLSLFFACILWILTNAWFDSNHTTISA